MAERQPQNPREEWYNTVGRVVLFCLGLAIFVPMVVGVWSGIQTGNVEDPFTGKEVAIQAVGEYNCLETARQLLDVPDSKKPSRHWEGRYTDWVSHCSDKHRDIYRLLEKTRSELLNRTSTGIKDSDQ